MYSFAQRNDMKVVDEPFYAIYLQETEYDHPGKEAILSSLPRQELVVIRQIERVAEESNVFVKNMASHFKVLNPALYRSFNTVFLIRDPSHIIRSYSKVIINPTEQDIGISRQVYLFDLYRKETGKTPIVIDSNDILEDPKQHLQSLCDRLSLEFQENMLIWPTGPKSYDGIWSQYWYKNVHRSAGFLKQSTGDTVLPDRLGELYTKCKKDYDYLYTYSITNNSNATRIQS